MQLFYQCISPSSYHLLHHATTQVTTQPSSALTKTSTLSCLPQSHAQTPAVDSEICCQRLIRATGNPGPRNQYNQFSSSPACYSTEVNSMRSCFPRHRPTIVSTSQDLFKTAVMAVSLTPFRTTTCTQLGTITCGMERQVTQVSRYTTQVYILCIYHRFFTPHRMIHHHCCIMTG